MNKDDVIRWATQARLPHDYETQELVWLDQLTTFAKLVAEHEREQCAVICENYADLDSGPNGIEQEYHAYLIRKRGEA